MVTAVNNIFGNRYLALPMALIAAGSAVFLTTAYPLLALLPGLVIIFLVLLDRYPTLVFLSIVITIPFGEFRHTEGSLGFIRIHWILGVFLAFFIFIHCLPRKDLWRQLRSNLWPPTLILLAVNLLSSFISPYPTTSYVNLALTFSAYAFMAVCLFFLPFMKVYRHALPAVLIWSVSIGSTLAIIGYFFGTERFIAGGRALGGAADPNNMALMVIFILPLIFHWLLHAPTLFKRAGASALIGLNLMAIVISFSRGGALVLAATLIGLLIEYRHRLRARHLGLWSMSLVVVAGLAFLLVPPEYWQRQRSLIKAEDVAMRRRASYLTVGFEAFQERPLLGYGPGSFRDIYADTGHARIHAYHRDPINRPERAALRRYAHNTYLEILIGNGILGFLPFLALLWTALKNFTQARREAVAAGDRDLAILTGSYRLSYISLLLFLMIFSGPYHKYLMLALALSHAALVVTSAQKNKGAALKPSSCS